ncbi:MAG: 1-acyl-sn-glycerol-3-phosphate acyltransferase [Bacteroidetes bacterium]|nr:1-acyl-sn-glycerol-3-phosphate acyltransferase [Bacteroidota bacterium]MCL2303529.1 1-acyl-sn-glycerol-3-phosphate acyltransferase [Lentimicrobiaceae bacterium]
MSDLQIDVRQTIASKNKKLAEWLPRFVIRWIEKLIHQDAMNQFLVKHRNDDAIEFARAVIEEFAQASITVANEEMVPKEGRYIVVSNHPLGAIDGLALISLMGKYRSDIKFPVNDLLMAITPMRNIFIPINKHGRNNAEAAKELHNIFESNDLILYFPAGLCSRKIDGKIQDLEWKKTIVQKAITYQRDIIPVFFDGKNSEQFYRIANWRKKLGIKANLEMILLPDEMTKQKGKNFTITFGKPIPYTTFDSSKNPKEWAAWLREKAMNLK